MWPATIATIRAVRPRFAFLENVPGLLSSGYFGRILGDLAESGYNARWRVLSAAEVGAPHKRDRLWVVADADKVALGEQLRGKWRKENRVGEWDIHPWKSEPKHPRVVDGLANQLERTECTGDGQVPIVAATAWRILTEGLI